MMLERLVVGKPGMGCRAQGTFQASNRLFSVDPYSTA